MLDISYRNANQNLGNIKNQTNPYFPTQNNTNDVSERSDIVFITSRFRSGSTVLWNVFRNVEGCTAYYEPFNERKWFNKTERGQHVDSTHLGVDDYSLEYDELSCLEEFYNERWIDTSLYMDENAWDPAMKSYICKMIEMAPSRPILQFNRIDFRLPWLKKNFPNAKFVHLYRHPRDQWCSFLTDKKLMNNEDVESSYHDAFYLDIWCNDLSKHFPFLDKQNTPHPYQRFYYVWKLSYLYGVNLADCKLAFETLTSSSKETLTELFAELNLDLKHLEKAAKVVEKTQLDKWKSYANNEWFEEHEAICEKVLEEFLK